MYQPQIEKWDDTTITFRAAIAVEPAEGAEPIYGMVRTTAQADVDKAARMVTLHDFQIVKVSFPTAPERNVSYLAILSQQLPTRAKEISLDRLEASLAVSQAVKKQRGLAVDNDPPRIFFSTHPALLVLVDGDPVLRPVRRRPARHQHARAHREGRRRLLPVGPELLVPGAGDRGSMDSAGRNRPASSRSSGRPPATRWT